MATKHASFPLKQTRKQHLDVLTPSCQHCHATTALSNIACSVYSVGGTDGNQELELIAYATVDMHINNHAHEYIYKQTIMHVYRRQYSYKSQLNK